MNRKQQYALQEQVQYAEISTVKVYTNVNNISTSPMQHEVENAAFSDDEDMDETEDVDMTM